MNTIQNTFKIVSNKRISPKFYHLVIDAREILNNINPGKFVHIKVREALDPFFRRPFSVFRAKKHLEILYEVVGQGTEILSKKTKGEAIDVVGPLGNNFSAPCQDTRKVVMIAGGVGVAPFLCLSDFLKDKNLEMVLLYGARTKDQIFNMTEYKKNGCKIRVSADDGSVGVKGRVSKLFKDVKIDETTFVYTCGPRPMMAAVQKFAKDNGLKGQGSCEEVMACGIGTCLGCSIKTTQGYRTVCDDGPVFDLEELIF